MKKIEVAISHAKTHWPKVQRILQYLLTMLPRQIKHSKALMITSLQLHSYKSGMTSDGKEKGKKQGTDNHHLVVNPFLMPLMMCKKPFLGQSVCANRKWHLLQHATHLNQDRTTAGGWDETEIFLPRRVVF